MKKLSAELSLPPGYLPPLDLITAKSLHEIVRRLYITVTKQKSGYICTGQFRLFRLCKACLDPESPIPVVVRPRTGIDAIRENLLIELLLIPALLGTPRNNLKQLGAAWSRADEHQLLTKLLTTTDLKACAKLFGVDPRFLKKDGKQDSSSSAEAES